MTMFFALFLACGGQQANNATQTAPAEKIPAATSVDRVKLAAAVQLADAADGVEDKVAQKCAGCALAMDGSPDHTILVDGVKLHLCSSMCKEEYSKDVGGNTLKLLQ